MHKSMFLRLIFFIALSMSPVPVSAGTDVDNTIYNVLLEKHVTHGRPGKLN